MIKDIKVVAIQAKVPLSVADGEAQVEKFVDQAVRKGVDLVGLPEDCIAPLRYIENGYDPLPFLSNLAKKHKIYLFGATTRVEAEGSKNIGFLFDRSGKLLAKHPKIVLTPPEKNDKLIPGHTIEVISTEFGKVAILVCKDAFHRYAAWFFEELRKADVDIVLVPSYSLNVSRQSVSFWADSLKALANWFGMYIIAPGTVGPNFTQYPSFGHAMIVSPTEGVLAEGSAEQEEILCSPLQAEAIDKARENSIKWQPNKPPYIKIVTGS